MRIPLALAVLIAGCGGGPTEPELIPPPEKPLYDVSVAGKWTAKQVNVFFDVTFDLTEHRPDSITGKWAGFTQCADYLGTGRVRCTPRAGLVTAGKRNGDVVTLTMDPGGMPCGYGHFIEVTRSGNTAPGTAKTMCGGVVNHYAMPVTLKRE